MAACAMNQTQLHIDDAVDYLGRHLAAKYGFTTAAPTGPVSPIQCASQYDVEVKYVAAAFWQSKGIGILSQTMAEAEQYFRPFFDAAWYLCRIGVLRPGEIAPLIGMRGPGWNGDGFSITSLGRAWLPTVAQRPPSDPGRFVQIVRSCSHSPRVLGPAFSNGPWRRLGVIRQASISRAVRWRAPPLNQFCSQLRSQKVATRQRSSMSIDPPGDVRA